MRTWKGGIKTGKGGYEDRERGVLGQGMGVLGHGKERDNLLLTETISVSFTAVSYSIYLCTE